MKTVFGNVDIPTRSRRELVDITQRVEKIVGESGIENGMCLVHSLHSTTGIVINEHEEGLMDDILTKIASDYENGKNWLHDRIDNNADAHLASTSTGPSKVMPVKGKHLLRGTWQNIFLLELDGPRANRRIVVEVLGE